MDGDRHDAGAARAHLYRRRRAPRLPRGLAVHAPRWIPASRDVPSALARVDGGEDAFPRSRFSRIEEPRESDVARGIGSWRSSRDCGIEDQLGPIVTFVTLP